VDGVRKPMFDHERMLLKALLEVKDKNNGRSIPPIPKSVPFVGVQ
jgi:hypothetical protein